MSQETMSRVFAKMAATDGIPHALLLRIYENARASSDLPVLVSVASRSDLPNVLHESILALNDPRLTAARIRYMDPVDLHALVQSATAAKILPQAAQRDPLQACTAQLLVRKGGSRTLENLMLNKSIGEDVRRQALDRYIREYPSMKNPARGQSAQRHALLVLGFPEHADVVFSALEETDPLHTGRLSSMLIAHLPWDTEAGNRAFLKMVSVYAATLVASRTESDVRPAPRKPARGKSGSPSRVRTIHDPQLPFDVGDARHPLSSIAKCLSFGGFRPETIAKVTEILAESTAALKADADAQGRPGSVGVVSRLESLVASASAYPAFRSTNRLSAIARAAGSCDELATLVSVALTGPGNPPSSVGFAGLLSVLVSPHYRHSLPLASLLATGSLSTSWPHLKKVLEHRSPLSPEVLATLCVARQACTPVSVAFIDRLLAYHRDPAATLEETLMVLKRGPIPATVDLVHSRYFDPSFVKHVPLCDLPSDIPEGVLKVLVSAASSPEFHNVNWDVLALTTDFSKASLEEALRAGKALG